MDPGTALAIVSLTFQLLGGCVQGFVLLCNAHNIGKVSGELLCLLSIQEVRLIDWARRAGLLGPDGCLDHRLNAQVIDAVLAQLNDLLADVEKLSKRYKFKLSSDPPDGLQQKDAKQLPSPTRVLGSAVSDETRGNILLRAKLIRTANVLPKRLWWAAVDEEKFRQFVGTIQTFVHELWNLLDPLTQDDMMKKIELTLAHAITQSKYVEDARTLGKAVALDARRSDGQEPSDDLLTNIAQLKVARLELDQLGDEVHSTISLRQKLTDSSLSQPEPLSWGKITDLQSLEGIADNALGIGQYDQQSSFVETRPIPDAPFARRIINERARRLAIFLHAPKHTMLRSLRCRGFAVSPDEGQLSFVFDLPAPGASPVSLRTLLGAKDGPIPSVTSRLQLATHLVQAVKYSHTAGWLHRNFRSENVVFFVGDRATAFESSAASPFPLPTIVGFAFARPDSSEYSERAYGASGSVSTDPARHIYCYPSYVARDMTARFEAYMEVYALGTVLVEIANWLPLSRLVRDIVDVKKVPAVVERIQEVRLFLVRSLQHDQLKIGFRMGDVFADVVKNFLTIGAVDIDQSLRVLESAAAALQKCHI